MADEFHTVSREGSSSPPAKKGRGCVFYGCLGLIVLAALALLAVVLITYFGARYFINNFTAPTPVELPTVKLPPEEQSALNQRVEQFEESARKVGDEPVTLVLTPRELNALFSEDPEVQGRLYLDIEDDHLVGQISVPLGELGVGVLKDRYLNGHAVFDVSAAEGLLVVKAKSITVNGRPLPAAIMAEIGERNFAENANQDQPSPIYLDDVHVEDGKVLLRARRRPEAEPPKP